MKHLQRFLLGIPYAGLAVLIILAAASAVRTFGWRPIALMFFVICVVLVIYCIGGLVEMWRGR